MVPVFELSSGLESTLRNQPLVGLVVLFGAGLATSLTPCVYPMIPITAGILGWAWPRKGKPPSEVEQDIARSGEPRAEHV